MAEEGDVDGFVDDIKRHLPGNFAAKGEHFVFVDECRRTQSGKLHRAMRELLPEATLIGFTGTPLLKDHKECVLVHEMVHLLERTHNDRFRCLMDDLMPQWRTRRDELNQAPLAHEDWTY